MGSSRFLNAAQGKKVAPPPIWLMRQAGRYLPEYRALRAQARSFVDFCLDPDLASEATLQPLRRFDLDAAIIFADILLLPHMAGATVRFVEGEGPQFTPIREIAEIEKLAWGEAPQKLSSVYETLGRVRAELPREQSVIGFAGAPWTVAMYMIGGAGGDARRDEARVWAWSNPEALELLMSGLADATANYLVAQARAGADALMIFDSWSGGLSPELYDRVVIAPTRRIVDLVRAAGVTCPLIGFPRGSGQRAPRYADQTNIDVLAIDTGLAAPWIVEATPKDLCLQGGLDPAALIAGGDALAREVDRLLEVFDGRPYIFNLGHGIWPTTPIDHVAQLVDRVKGARSRGR